jgi:hypothetical protein
MLVTLLLLFALVAFVPNSPDAPRFAAAQELGPVILPSNNDNNTQRVPAAAEASLPLLTKPPRGPAKDEDDVPSDDVPSLAPAAAGKGTPGLNCSTIEGLIGGMTNVTLFTQREWFHPGTRSPITQPNPPLNLGAAKSRNLRKPKNQKTKEDKR